ncbi:RecQ-mediated genome instability protein 1 [Escovopsis weberi]|uniref:RecQ-mediated genome instability protein 1 n=1 Tax=Escovopsis weberi TaxID=150374 RepID=A0A0M9VSP7_ESCWE|nr:RecQ-mediated genome instability protein 1 [Escovopsis weberi]
MDLASQLRAAIAAQSLPTPSPTLLSQLTTTSTTTTTTTARQPAPPLASLLATAKARLLACDIAGSTLVDPGLAAFPPGIASTARKEARLPHDVFVQVLDVENLSASRWDQVEELEAVERGERTRGRQVIRVAADEAAEAADDGDDDDGLRTEGQDQDLNRAQNQNQGQGQAGLHTTHRLVLQDRMANRVFAVELRRIPRIGVGKTCIGEKMLIRAGTQVARGTVLLGPDNCVLLGGKIDAWHDAWVQGRLARLKEAVAGQR